MKTLAQLIVYAIPPVGLGVGTGSPRPFFPSRTLNELMGASKVDGSAIYGVAFLAQAMGYAITTPKNQLVMRRTFGSGLPDVLGRNLDENTLLLMYTIIAKSLAPLSDWFELSRVQMLAGDDLNRPVLSVAGSSVGHGVLANIEL